MTERDKALAVKWASLPSVVAYEFTSDPTVVSDLVSLGHATLCRAAMAFDETRGVAFQTFAGICLRRDYGRYLQRLSARSAFEESGTVSGALETLGSDSGDDTPSQAISSLEARRLLSSLPLDLREVLVLVAVEGKSFSMAGRALGVSSVTAWSRYQRALKIVRCGVVDGTDEPVLPMSVKLLPPQLVSECGWCGWDCGDSSQDYYEAICSDGKQFCSFGCRNRYQSDKEAVRR